MVNVQQSLVLNASARDVWAVVGDFDKLNEWHAAVQSIESEETSEGHMRSLALLGGTKKLVEQLDELDEENLSYSYHIIDGPLPVADFRGTIAVSPHGGDAGSIVSWVARFEPKGTTEEDATATTLQAGSNLPDFIEATGYIRIRDD